MKSPTRWGRFSLVFWLVLMCGASWAQRPFIELRPPRPGWGSTPLSTVIGAQSSYIYAVGTCRVNTAIAREINARAVQQEIQNSVEAVDAYFKRRELNREARAKENPNHWERMKKLQEQREETLRYRYQELLKGGDESLTDELNRILRELAGPTLAEEFLYSGAPLADSRLDAKIEPFEVDKIWLTDGGRKGSQLTFRAGQGDVMECRWPLGLRGPECALARNHFEQARDETLAALRAGKTPVTQQQYKELLLAIDELLTSLETEYPKERRLDVKEFGTYRASKVFLQSLLVQVNRLANSDDTSLFDRSTAFHGDSVVDLLRYMYHNGFLFAPPKPGAEETYRKLFKTMRELYLNLVAEPTLEPPVEPAEKKR
jgi:hypothetical protein